MAFDDIASDPPSMLYCGVEAWTPAREGIAEGPSRSRRRRTLADFCPVCGCLALPKGTPIFAGQAGCLDDPAVVRPAYLGEPGVFFLRRTDVSIAVRLAEADDPIRDSDLVVPVCGHGPCSRVPERRKDQLRGWKSPPNPGRLSHRAARLAGKAEPDLNPYRRHERYLAELAKQDDFSRENPPSEPA
jgi:hypothetical protein